MNDQSQGDGGKVSARRRLIRGVFAAPAALTLYSGSVMAARSVRNCVTKRIDSGSQSPPLWNGPGQDTWLRVPLVRYRGLRDGTPLSNRTSRWINGADIAALQALNTNVPYLTNGKWQLYDRGTASGNNSCNNINPASAYANQSPGYLLTGTPSEAGGPFPCNGQPGTVTLTDAAPVVDQWVAVRVDSNGDIVGVVGIDTSAGASAIAGTCWSSFRLG